MWDLTARRKGSPELHLQWPARGSRRSAQQRKLDYLEHPSYSIGNGRVEMMIYREMDIQAGPWCERHLDEFFFYFPEIRRWLDEHDCAATHDIVGNDPSILINGPLDAVMRIRDRIMDHLHDFGPVFRGRDDHAPRLVFVTSNRKERMIAAHNYKEALAIFDEYWPHKRQLKKEAMGMFTDGMILSDPPYGKVGDFLRVAQNPVGIQRYYPRRADAKVEIEGFLLARTKTDLGLATLFGLC